MAKTGPRKIEKYAQRFKATAVKLSRLPGIRVQDVANLPPIWLTPRHGLRWRQSKRMVGLRLVVMAAWITFETRQANGGGMRAALFVVWAVVVLCLSREVDAEERIFVTVPAILDPGAPIGEGVRRECGVESRVGEEVFTRVSERLPGMQRMPPGNAAAPDGTLLRITILSAFGAGGGAWSGSKSITIRADVVENAKTILTKTLMRRSSGGPLGGMSGTCPIMERIAVALRRDVAAWLPQELAFFRRNSVSATPPPAQPVKDAAATSGDLDKPQGAPKQGEN